MIRLRKVERAAPQRQIDRERGGGVAVQNRDKGKGWMTDVQRNEEKTHIQTRQTFSRRQVSQEVPPASQQVTVT